MNVIGKGKGHNPRGRFTQSRKVSGVTVAQGIKGSGGEINPSATEKTMTPFARVTYAIISAAAFILRITEESETRITEEGVERAVEQ